MHKNLDSENTECESCKTFLPELSFLIQDFMTWVWRLNPDVHIYGGFRNEKAQDIYYAEGKTKDLWPNSKHNNTLEGRPFSNAVDLFVLTKDGAATFPIDRYQEIYDQALLSSQPITWGGTFKDFPDSNHYEVDT